MRIEATYKQLPKFTVSGFVLKMQDWRFSCGAIDPASPQFIFRDLPAGNIVFTADPSFDKFATLYIVPTKTISPEFPSGSNYYLTEWVNDPALGQTSNPPTEKWTPDISVVPCLSITIKAGATTLEVVANEFDLPDPPDPRRDVVSGGWRITAFVVGKQVAGYKLLDATVHASAFPVLLGRLGAGEAWYAKKEA